MRNLKATYLWAIMLAVLFTSCESWIYDEEGDCETVYELQFVYDHNLKWADAFPSEVEAVTLHVFDAATGAHVMSATERGDILRQEGYTMRLDIPAGDYQMVAWCGEGAHDDGVSFSIPEIDHSTSRREHLQCRMTRTPNPDGTGSEIKTDGGLNALFHGQITATLPEGEGQKVRLKMPLVKNTNRLKVVLQSLSGKEINPDEYSFTVEDNNGLMDWDNTVLDDEPLTFHPWSVSGGSAEILRSGDEEAEKSMISAVVADMTLGRLMTDHKPILTAWHNSGDSRKAVFRIPLIDYALMVKGKYKHDMTDQEYLDRQDEYNMTFFLTESNEWMNAFIYINSWKVVTEDIWVE
ncbi:MAG: FimB/Mfa2 family fimbrial subunit [Bacteroidales bacterium]|nr:FimB/Mfa2 family fimbrial subunit [Bacteroidales bacterium]